LGLADLLIDLANLPLAGICLQVPPHPADMIKEIKSYFVSINRMPDKTPYKPTILFHLNSMRSDTGQELISLLQQAKFSSIAFVEDCQPGYTKSSCHLEVDAKLPLAVFAQSYDVSLEKLDRLKYFAVIYPDIRPLVEDAYQRLLIRLSSYGYLTNKNLVVMEAENVNPAAWNKSQ
jgi:hypothetical protein